jgi:RNA polymerase subunit RPABC4/transcription elongation factor Spt4
MSEENLDVPMAQCGACNSIVPLDSESCPNCGVRFGGVTDEQLGECGSCSAIIPVDSESCPECGASFVAVEEAQVDEPTVDTAVAVSSGDLDDLNDLILPESEVEESSDEVEDTPVAEDDVSEAEQPEIETHEAPGEQEVEEADEPVEISESTPVEVDDEPDIDSFIDDVEEPTIDEEPEPVAEEVVEEEEAAEDSSEEVVQESNLEDETETEEDPDTAVDQEEEADSSEEDTEEEVAEEESEEEKPAEEAIEDSAIAMAFDNLALAIADSGMTAAEAFGEIDTSEDQLIDAPELQKGIEKIAGEKLSPKHVTAILNHLDKDGNRRVDPNELIKALEDLRIGIQPGKMPKIKQFPSPVQKFLMGKAAKDIFYPIGYFLMITFIGLWVVNGIGLLVDGTGGIIVYEGGVDEFGDEIDVANWNLCQSDALEEIPEPCFGSVEVGETYPCDPAVDSNKCANSLTPFSGENGASSMPAGFYGDGIFMIALGVIGVAIIAFLHLSYAPALREKARAAKEGSEESVEDEDSEEDDSALDAPKNLVVEEKYDDVDGNPEEADQVEDTDDIEDDDEDDDGEDIDIGSRVGVDDEDNGEWFGVVTEFDEDDDNLVIVKSEDDGEEYEVEWDMLFIPEDEDDE